MDYRLNGIRALTFDTGGTVLDWHTTITSGFERFAERAGAALDSPDLTRAWRVASTGAVKEYVHDHGGRAAVDMDGILRRTLVATLAERAPEIQASDDDLAELVRTWRAMRPWDDVVGAFERLRRRYFVVSFTIMKTALVLEASKLAGISWDAIISCEMIGIYKTHPDAYATVARWLDLAPSQIMMVTAHNDDLVAAHDAGFATAFVRRPREWGDAPNRNAVPDPRADVVADDLTQLADLLGSAVPR